MELPIYKPGSPNMLAGSIPQMLRMRIVRAQHARERGDQEAVRQAEQDVLNFASMLLSMPVNVVLYDGQHVAGSGPIVANYTSEHSIIEVIS